MWWSYRTRMSVAARGVMFGILAGLISAGPGVADPIYTDPVGYLILSVPGSSERILSMPFAATSAGRKVTVTSVGDNYVEIDSWFGWNVVEPAGSGNVGVREGNMAGITLAATSAFGNRVYLDRSPVGLVSPGDVVDVRRDWMLEELFDLEAGNMLVGPDSEHADLIGILDASTQTLRNYYFKEGVGWSEVGASTVGDKGHVPVAFPSGVQYLRRGTEPLELVVYGAVPLPVGPYRYLPIHAGRNLLSSPFTGAESVGHLGLADGDSSYAVVSSTSAPSSDTLRFTYLDGTTSPVLYHNQESGWRVVGGGNGESIPIDINVGIDFQRIGADGFLRFNTAFPEEVQSAAKAVTSTLNEIPIDPELCERKTRRIGWKSEPGSTYQLQVRAAGRSSWTDCGDPVLANGEICQSILNGEGSGLLRVIKLP